MTTVLCVTTWVNADAALEATARTVADGLGAPYARRRNITAARLFLETGADRMLIVRPDHYVLRDRATAVEYAYHPNLAMLRALNVQRGWRDVFLDAAGLGPGDHVLDCTVGFAGEAALASLAVGEAGRVVGLESVAELAVVTKAGVAGFLVNPKTLCAALRRIEIVAADYGEYLAACASKSFDVVYFDPFFDDRLPGSESSLHPLAVFGDNRPLDSAAVHRARIVARRRVVVKCPRTEPFPADIAHLVDEKVAGRKSRLAYHVIPAAGE